VPLEFHFENVKSLFLAQGVEFSVKCDEVLEGDGEGGEWGDREQMRHGLMRNLYQM
jgi:hypothetical protein